MAKYTIFLLLLLAFSTNAQQSIEEELLIFVQPEQQSEFTKNNLKTLTTLLKEQGIQVQQLDVSKVGAPKEVGFTPFIVYRNHLGRKVYKGRYTTHQRLLNFIRTVRRLPEAAINYQEKEVFVREYDRAALLLKPKITAPTGKTEGLDLAKINQQALQGLEKSLENWTYNTSYAVTDGDELFYMNFYPYIAEDGKVYVSAELYAHYDCHTPIYQQYKTPAVGQSVETAFAQAGKDLLAEINRQLVESEAGDAMHFLSQKTKQTPWDKLPLQALQVPKRTTSSKSTTITLPQNWEMQGPVAQGAPLLSFNFPAPLRHYGGELKKVAGKISLKDPKSFAHAQGRFVVDVNSLQMGQAELDSYVKGSLLLVNSHPEATLIFKKVIGNDLNLQLGRLTIVQIEAELQLLGKTSQVIAQTELEPFINEEGDLLMNISTQFTLEDLLGNFEIEGPDGPKEANNKLIMQANFLVRPSSQPD